MFKFNLDRLIGILFQGDTVHKSFSQPSSLPYYTSTPLSQDTQWIAIPIYISSTDTTFNTALKNAQKILSQVEKVSQIEKSKSCSSFLMHFTSKIEVFLENNIPLEKEEFDKLKREIQFIQNPTAMGRNNYNVIISTYVILKLEDTLFWNNMEHISNILDTLYLFELGYKKDKLIFISVGKNF